MKCRVVEKGGRFYPEWRWFLFWRSFKYENPGIVDVNKPADFKYLDDAVWAIERFLKKRNEKPRVVWSN